MSTLKRALIHDLRNKITIAEGFSGLVLDSLPEESAQYMDARRIHDALHDALDILSLLQAELSAKQA